MATANVVVSRSGTGFTIDVTAVNLDADLTLKDFIVLHNGTLVPTTSYTKTTRTVLTYNGLSFATTTIEIRRSTPVDVIQPITYANRMDSNLWNRELDRKTRWQEEIALNGAGSASVNLPIPKDDVYGSGWNGDTIYPPTRNAVYDKLETMSTRQYVSDWYHTERVVMSATTSVSIAHNVATDLLQVWSNYRSSGGSGTTSPSNGFTVLPGNGWYDVSIIISDALGGVTTRAIQAILLTNTSTGFQAVGTLYANFCESSFGSFTLSGKVFLPLTYPDGVGRHIAVRLYQTNVNATARTYNLTLEAVRTHY